MESYQVRMIIYDLQGQQVAVLYNGLLDAGTHEFTWEGKDQSGRKLSAGIYLCKTEVAAENGSRIFTHKLIIQ
jgi:flagellar hook assembly protein FlgD